MYVSSIMKYNYKFGDLNYEVSFLFAIFTFYLMKGDEYMNKEIARKALDKLMNDPRYLDVLVKAMTTKIMQDQMRLAAKGYSYHEALKELESEIDLLIKLSERRDALI